MQTVTEANDTEMKAETHEPTVKASLRSIKVTNFSSHFTSCFGARAQTDRRALT